MNTEEEHKARNGAFCLRNPCPSVSEVASLRILPLTLSSSTLDSVVILEVDLKLIHSAHCDRVFGCPIIIIHGTLPTLRPTLALESKYLLCTRHHPHALHPLSRGGLHACPCHRDTCTSMCTKLALFCFPCLRMLDSEVWLTPPGKGGACTPWEGTREHTSPIRPCTLYISVPG